MQYALCTSHMANNIIIKYTYYYVLWVKQLHGHYPYFNIRGDKIFLETLYLIVLSSFYARNYS